MEIIKKIDSSLRLVLNPGYDEYSIIFKQEVDVKIVKELSDQLNIVIFSHLDDPLTVSICLKLSLTFIGLHVKEHVTISITNHLNEAIFYFHLSDKSFRQYPHLLSGHEARFTNLAKILCYSRTCFVVHTSSLDSTGRISYLLDILDFQEKFHLETNVIWNQLGKEYFILGEKYFVDYIETKKQDSASLSVTNYEMAIKYYESLLNYLNKSNNVMYCLMVARTKIRLAFCQSSLSTLRYDLKSMRNCLTLWQDVLTLPLAKMIEQQAIECRDLIKDFIDQITVVLNQILKSCLKNMRLTFFDKYIKIYLRNKFQIEIADSNLWAYQGDLLWEDLKALIEQELR